MGNSGKMPKYSWPELSPDSLPFLCFAYGDLSKSGDFLPSRLLDVFETYFQFSILMVFVEAEGGPRMKAKKDSEPAGS